VLGTLLKTGNTVAFNVMVPVNLVMIALRINWIASNII